MYEIEAFLLLTPFTIWYKKKNHFRSKKQLFKTFHTIQINIIS